jgi:hypothetical protein
MEVGVTRKRIMGGAIMMTRTNTTRTSTLPRGIKIMERTKVMAKTTTKIMMRRMNTVSGLIPAMAKKKRRMKGNGADVRVAMAGDRIMKEITTRITIGGPIKVTIKVTIRTTTGIIIRTIIRDPTKATIAAVSKGVRTAAGITTKDGPGIKVSTGARDNTATRTGPAARAVAGLPVEDSPAWIVISDVVSPAKEDVPTMKKEGPMGMTRKEEEVAIAGEAAPIDLVRHPGAASLPAHLTEAVQVLRAEASPAIRAVSSQAAADVRVTVVVPPDKLSGQIGLDGPI